MLSKDPKVLELVDEIDKRITASVKHLLETKHLYQSTTVEYADLLEDLPDDAGVGLSQGLQKAVLSAVNGDWAPIDRADHRPLLGDGPPPGIRFETPDVKLFCSICKRVEAFNSVSSEDFSCRGHPRTSFEQSREAVQVFALSFQCQSCKSVPEVFLVRRHGLKLTQSGRSPIEHVEVHPAVPKSLHKWFRSAIVAYQSGQTLAGIFLLRTLIEQWVREITQQPDLQADRVLEAYMGLLPPDFKARFPSLSSLYGDLSDDLHRAIGSSVLFESAKADIIKHFEARRVFNL
ncbi:hypothetical protein KAX17_05025 [Candidatus Bipolaricaulota bacterium]|nr:hypothetical protein [Candidatus Bipolaricaulota bacterium]